MIPPLAKFIDWSALKAMAMGIPRTHGQNPRLEEALKLLNGSDCFPVESRPAWVEFGSDGSGVAFHFPTPRPGGFTENNTVYGRLYRCPGRWQERPVILLLHGWGDFPNYQFRFPMIARHCNRAGFNAATLVAPCHFQRRPRQPGAVGSPA